MKFFLTILTILISFLSVNAQMCNTSPTSMGALTLTSSWQNASAASGAKRYWTFTATAGCTYDFSSCNSVNTNDTYLRLYSGTNPASAVLQTSNDDNGVFCTSNKASLSWTCGTSGAYSILLTNYSCANISANSILSYRLTCPSTNDNCSGATTISSLPYTSSTISNNPSTDDVPTSTSSCGTQGSNLWFVVAGNNNQITATTCNALTDFDTEVRVYTGSCSSLNSMVEVVCNDDDASCNSSTLFSTVTWCSEVGTNYYISVGYYASGAGYGNFVLSVTNGSACSALPIQLISFTGENFNDYNVLKWVTATETNNDYFTLEKSIDGVNFDIVGYVNGAGNSTITHNYKLFDDKLHDGVTYYRLKQTDYDNNSKTFNIIDVLKKVSNVNIKLIRITDILGREVSENYDGVKIYYFDNGTVLKKYSVKE